MKKFLHKQKLHFLFAFFLFFTCSSVFALEKGEVSSNTSLKNEESERMRIRMGGEFTADITVSACNSATITYTIKIINITGSPKLRSVMSVIPTDAGAPFNISAVDNTGATWTNESTSSLLKLTTSTSVLNKNDYLIITFSTPSVTFSPWDITGYTNAGYTSNSVFLSGVLPSVQGPTAGTLSPSPAAGAICSGGVVSATATGGTGSGPITDKLLYRYDGGAWQPYTSNTALVTAGHTSVDIQTYSFYNSDAGCAPSVPVTVSWIINAQPTSGTLSPSPTAGSVCAGTNVSASATPGAGGAGTISDVLQYRFDGGSWQTYTSGANLSTIGHNTVDIQTYRTASGSNCTSSTPLIVSWTINQKSAAPTSASASPATICSGQSTNLTLNGGGGGFSEIIKWYTASCGGTLAGTGNNLSVSPTSTTTYYGRYENAAPCNFNTACASVTVTVTTPPSVSTQPVNQTITYGSPVSFSVSATGSTGYQWQENTGSGFVNISNTGIYSGVTTATLSLSQPTVSMSGYKYRVIVSGICSSVTSTQADLLVGTKTVTVTAEAKTKTYGDADPALTYAFSGLVGTDSFSGSLSRTPGENVGTYAINQNSLALSSNYILNYTGANLTIGAKTISVTAEAKTKTYGDADPALTYTFSGLVGTDSFNGSLSRAAGENVGTYAINQNTLALNSNYVLSYTGANLIIGTKTINVTAETKAKTYGDTDPALTYTFSGLIGTDSFSGSLSRAAGENVGTYAINQNDLALSGNYILNYTGANLTIGTKTITVTAEVKSKTYGDADPALTYTFSGLVGTDSFSGSLSRAAGENVGTYAINQNDLALSGNYILNYTGANLTIGTKTINVTAEAKAKTYGDTDPALTYTFSGLVGTDSFIGSLSRAAGENVGTYAINQNNLALSGNYILNYTGANLTIGTKTINVTAEAKAKTYGDADPALTYTITSGALVGTDSFSGSLSRATGENVGIYAINQNTLALNSNYILEYTGANLVIGTQIINVIAETKAKTYGDSDPALTYTFTGSIGTDSFSGSLSRAPGENVGTYVINQNTLALSGNYILNFTSANLTIASKAITVSAEAKTKTYGDADPALTYTITSGAMVGTDSFSGSLGRKAGENVGTYAINQNTLALSSNYTLNYTGANLSIGTKSVTVTAEAKTKTYGDADPALTYTITSVTGSAVNTSNVFLDISKVTSDGGFAYIIDVDPTQIGDSNEQPTVSTMKVFENGIQIGSAHSQHSDIRNAGMGLFSHYGTRLRFSSSDNTDPRTNGRVYTYSITTSGSLVGTDFFSGALSRAGGENVGTYVINQNTLALNSNYVLTFNSANLTIGTKAINVAADVKNKTYGDADPALSYTIVAGPVTSTANVHLDLSKVTSDGGFAYSIDVDPSLLGDSNGQPAVSTLKVIENGLEIGSAHSQHADIRNIGKGLFSHYGTRLRFSSSDNTDPRTNGRVYTYNVNISTTSGELVAGDSFSGSLSRAAGENVGTYAINQNTLALNSNYVLNYTGANLIIGTKTINVTAEAKTKTYGDADPPLTYTFSGLMGTDSFSGSLSRTPGENVGTYTINQNSLALGSNYILNYTGANLIIGTKTINVTAEAKTKTYGDADPALTYTFSGLVGTDSFSGSLSRTAGENVGTYAINQNGLALSSNYILNYTGANLVIGTKTITVTAEAKAKTYGDADPALTYTFSGLVGTDSFIGSLSRAAGENVGTYAINQNDLALSGNYILNYTGANLTIGTKTINVTAEAKAKTYGDTDPALTYTFSGLVGTDSFIGSLSRAAGENVGTYAINQNNLALSGNYILNYTGANLTIGTKTINVTAEAKAKTYGDADPALTYTITSGALVGTDSFSGSLSRATGENVGIYAINQNTLALNSNYILEYTGANLVIGTQIINVIAETKAKTYGDSDPALTYTFTGSIGTDSFSGSLSRAPGENVGTYVINQNTLALSGNYILNFTSANLTIASKAITVSAEAKTKTYGDADPALTYTITSGAMVGTDSFSGSLGRKAGENVGTYAINQNTLALSSNYTLNYTGANLSIGTKSVTVTAEAKTKTYGDADPALTYTFSGLVGTDSFSGSLSRPAGENVGTYAINQNTLALNGNYILDYTGANLIIGTKTITVTAETKAKTYGDADPALTYTIASGALVGTDSFTGSLSRTPGENVGTYAINQNNLALSGNYILNYTAANLTIDTKTITVTAEAKTKTYGDADPALTYTFSGLVGTDSFSGSLSRTAGENVGTYAINQNSLALSSNYILNYIAANLSIGTKTINVTAEAKTKTYGDADPALTYTFSGLVGTDSFNGSLSRTAGENVGTYAINQNTLALNSNYVLSYTGANLIIGTKTINVTAEAKTKTYGDADPALTYTSSPLVSGDSFSGALSRTTGENVGTYAINQNTLALNSNYMLNFTSENLTIGKGTLVITANNQSKSYGADNPVLTASYSGFVNGDTFNSLTTQPVVSTTATSGFPVGTHPITVGGASSPNYNISYVDGLLTVNPVSLVLSTDNQGKPYGSAFTAFTGTFSGIRNGDNLTATYTSIGSAATANAGNYPIVATLIDPDNKLGNYTVVNNGAVLTVNKASLDLRLAADNQRKTYGSVFSAFTGTFSGIQNGDNLTATYTSTGSSATAPVGTYLIVASLVDPDNKLRNYTVSNPGAVLTVEKASLTITANNQTKAYNAINPILTANYNGFVNGDTPVSLLTQPAITTTARTGSVTGSYPVKVSGASSGNYSINYVDGTLTITPGELTLANSIIDENKVSGTLVGLLNTTGAYGNASFNYSLVNGDGNTDNESFMITGKQLLTTQSFDFERKNSYSIRIQSTDNSSMSLEQIFTITVNDVNEVPTINAIADQVICTNSELQTVSLSGITAGPEANQTYTLSVSSDNNLFDQLNIKNGQDGTAKLTYQLKPDANGIANLTIKVADNGGKANGGMDELIQKFKLTTYKSPNPQITSDKGASISKGDWINLTASGGVNYVWADASGVISGQNTATLTVRPKQTTTYIVSGANANGCPFEQKITIEAREDFKFIPNNILSPNGDGVNDIWVVKNIDLYPDNEVRVFDRAERLVYTKKGYLNDWDGTSNGDALTEGTYYYIITLGSGFDKVKGFVSIVREKIR
ncbi:MBG domain-containing protein [Pedobacter sp. P351]|uniref:MBG domain-containing protein n=1 Tax=Pedobacter superstes TaxID=3133441 RepID=UPI00309B06A4